MLILPALVTLFTFLYWRPHQIFELLHPVTIYPLLAFVVLTYLLDFRTGWTRLRRSPLLALLGAFVAWCFITVLVKAPDRFGEEVPKLLTSFFVLFFIAQGVQSLRALKAVIYVLMVFSLGLAVLGVEQGLSASTADPAARSCSATRTASPAASTVASTPAGWGPPRSAAGCATSASSRTRTSSPGPSAWASPSCSPSTS
jgi:hypothetical protein